MGINFSFKFGKKIRYGYKGKEYENIADMPEEARLELKAPATGKGNNEEEEDEELKDISGNPETEELKQKTDSGQPPLSNEAVSAGKWYAGVILCGLFFSYLAGSLGLWLLNARPLPPGKFALFAFFLLASAGLIKRNRWARWAVLAVSPFFVIITLGIIHKHQTANPSGLAIFILLGCSFSFVYLLLPGAARLFSVPRPPSSERRLADAPQPPRKISVSLRLAILFGNHFILICWFVSMMVFVPLLSKMNSALGGVARDPSVLSGPGLILPAIYLFSVAVSAFTGWWAFRWTRMQLDCLENWRICHALLKSKVKIKMGDDELYRLKFEYEVDGQKYSNISDNPFTSRFEDEAFEPMLYNPAKPRQSMLVDELPAHIILGEAGELKSKYPFMGWLYASLPLFLLAVMTYFAFR